MSPGKPQYPKGTPVILEQVENKNDNENEINLAFRPR